MLILSMLFLCSCSIGGSRTEMLNNRNDDEKAENRLEEVIEALENNDKDAMRAIFSKQALDDADDFDGNMEHLLELFQGGIDSWEEPIGASVSEENYNLHAKIEVSSYYYVITENKKYFFLLLDYPTDTDNPDNVGLYMLLVVNAEEEKKYMMVIKRYYLMVTKSYHTLEYIFR